MFERLIRSKSFAGDAEDLRSNPYLISGRNKCKEIFRKSGKEARNNLPSKHETDICQGWRENGQMILPARELTRKIDLFHSVKSLYLHPDLHPARVLELVDRHG